MTKIIFFEKTGCINNKKQKELLTLAGHTVTSVDLIKHEWDYEQLVSFFSGVPVKEWFNPMAPEIRDGKIDPEAMTEAEAMQLLMSKHILIRRPLMQIGSTNIVGFNVEKLSELISLVPVKDVSKALNLIQSDFSTCPAKEARNVKCTSEPKCK